MKDDESKARGKFLIEQLTERIDKMGFLTDKFETFGSIFAIVDLLSKKGIVTWDEFAKAEKEARIALSKTPAIKQFKIETKKIIRELNELIKKQ